MAADVASDGELDALSDRIDRWAATEIGCNPLLVAVDRGEPGTRRWYLRLRGEERDITTIWLTLGQRSLQYEAYVLPAPEENHAEFYEQLLRRNSRLHGVCFCIGDEDAVYLTGALAVDAFDEDELDRIVGTVWAAVELCFRPALRLGWSSHYH